MILILAQNARTAEIALTFRDRSPKNLYHQIHFLVMRVRGSQEADWALEVLRDRVSEDIIHVTQSETKYLRSNSVNSAVELLARLQSHHRVRAVLLWNDTSSSGRPVSIAAQKLRIFTVLIQDGFLDFEDIDGKAVAATVDPNASWGRTSPDRIYVWGDARKNRLLETGHDPERVRVAGRVSIQNSVAPAAIGSEEARADKVYFADQPVPLQKKVSFEVWTANVEAVARHYSESEFTIILHPSSTQLYIEKLEAKLKHCARFVYSTPQVLGAAQLVTAFSTVAIDRVQAGLPVVIADFENPGILLPKIEDPLISRIFVTTEGFTFPVSGSRLKPSKPISFFVDNYSGELTIQSALDEIASLPASAGSLTSADFCPPDLQVVAITHLIRSDIGVSKSVETFRAVWQETKPGHFLLLPSVQLRPLEELTKEGATLFFNGLAAVLALRVKDFLWLWSNPFRKIRLVLWLHESGSIFRRAWQRKWPRILALFLSQGFFSVMGVSELHRKQLAGIGFRGVSVLENPAPQTEKPLPPDRESSYRPLITVVGSKQPRKGVELFSAVADLAASNGHSIDFHWCGPDTPLGSGLYYSPNARWQSSLPESQVMQLMRQADVIWIPSTEDPAPLVLTEAVSLGVPVVASSAVGNIELADRLGVGVAADAKTPAEWLEVIHEMVSFRPSISGRAAFLEHFGLKKILDRLAASIT